MKFTDAEINFLLGPHQIEHAEGRTRELRAVVDLRALGCPGHLFERICEDRARKLGGKFIEFRAANAPPPGTTAPLPTLAESIAAAKLF